MTTTADPSPVLDPDSAADIDERGQTKPRRGFRLPSFRHLPGRLSKEQFQSSPLGPVARRQPPKRNKWLDRWGWYEVRPEGAWTSTRQAEALNVATMRRSVRTEGLMTGLNKISQSMVITDPFELYGAEIENINVAVVGDIGKAKSSLIKTALCWRQLALWRQVVVIDKKRQGNRGGEYGVIADALGVASIRFRPGQGGARLNLLDPAISTGSARVDGVTPAGQETLVAAVIEDTMSRPLVETEIAALNLALRLVNERAIRDEREPDLIELSDQLLNPGEDTGAVFGPIWDRESARWGRDPGLALRRLCEGDLKGLVDGATSPEIRAALEYPFVHFDVSDLPTKGPALRVIMTVINTWLANVLAARAAEHEQTLLLVEESWHVAEGSTGKVFRDNMKLSRGLGLSTVSAFHHISDQPKNSPARALMQEAGIVFLYGQDRVEDAQETVDMYHLPPGSVEIIMSLPKGHCLVKYGKADPILMEHVRSDIEIELTDTDEVIKGVAA
ncbi:ATP/GTP-binding motif-containing protein (plasmid) [Rhodococcus opacus]|uniref:ATP/GTP-binding motif-containing protein n=1 Tax=Rhodococcus opacus TaxID=37919 RepID=A0A1B1KJ96_RHOOP|nr:ATP/GTP-binding protein [Rhodococcus opacus]ANS32644.1 ATP/GTP-binding motif-containing protein [Rhodococcus opacus]